MPLQTSGQISLSNVAGEKGVSLSNVSLVSLSTTSINTDSCNPTNPNNGAPHSISEFYGYDHNCVTQSLYMHELFGTYRDSFEACLDQGRSVESFVLYSDCQFLSLGCGVFNDSTGAEPFLLDGWFFQATGLGGAAWQITGGRVAVGDICDGGAGGKPK